MAGSSNSGRPPTRGPGHQEGEFRAHTPCGTSRRCRTGLGHVHRSLREQLEQRPGAPQPPATGQPRPARRRNQRRLRLSPQPAPAAAAGAAAASTAPVKSNAKVGLVFDIGGKGDKSFNDAADAGLMKAATDMGVTTKELTPNSTRQ